MLFSVIPPRQPIAPGAAALHVVHLLRPLQRNTRTDVRFVAHLNAGVEISTRRTIVSSLRKFAGDQRSAFVIRCAVRIVRILVSASFGALEINCG